MKYSYRPQGTCSTNIELEVENDIVKQIKFSNGCDGNAQGIAKLVQGMKVEDVISRLKGISCGRRNTSCPDQLARALSDILK